MELDLENISKEELFDLLLTKQVESDTYIHRIDEQERKIEEQEARFKSEIARKNYIIDNLTRMLFGQKRERFEAVDTQQLKLPFEEYATQEEKADETPVKEVVTYERKKATHPGRKPLPEHLSEVIHVIEPEESTEGFVKIGEERTEILEYNPSSFFKLVIVRPKYALKDTTNDDFLEKNKQVVIAQMPTRPIEKCLAGNKLLSSILINKYIDHLPLYRQVQIFKRSEVDISPSTIDSWVRSLGNLLEPLYKRLIREIKAQTYLQVDETNTKVLDRTKKGKTHLGYYWTYYAPLSNLVCFDYQKGRDIEAPQYFLEGYEGTLQTDGYNVYKHYYSNDKVVHMACWAHARRYFEKARNTDRPRAEYVLTEIQKLYQIERDIANLTPQEKKKTRLDESLPIIDRLGKWLHIEHNNILPKSPIGIAISYTMNLWISLQNYLNDGNLMIDNNLIENKIRPIALGRKNYLFAGSHNGAMRSAMFYSFFGSCKINDINPLLWMEYVLENISDWKANKLQELLPNNINKEKLNNFKPFYKM